MGDWVEAVEIPLGVNLVVPFSPRYGTLNSSSWNPRKEMNSIDLIVRNLKNSRDIVLARVEEMGEHALVPPTPNGGGHTLWILGHLAFIEGLVIRAFVFGEANPLAGWEDIFDGKSVPQDEKVFPPFGEVLEKCREMRASTLTCLAKLSEEDLDQVGAQVPEGQEAILGTYRHGFQFVADHWFMHRGQLADARRASGLERMWF